MLDKRINKNEVPQMAAAGLETVKGFLQGTGEELPNAGEVYVVTIYQGEGAGLRKVVLVPIKTNNGNIYVGDGKYVSGAVITEKMSQKVGYPVKGILCRSMPVSGVVRSFPEIVCVDDAQDIQADFIIASITRDSTSVRKIKTTSGETFGLIVMTGEAQGFKNKL